MSKKNFDALFKIADVLVRGPHGDRTHNLLISLSKSSALPLGQQSMFFIECQRAYFKLRHPTRFRFKWVCEAKEGELSISLVV